MKYWPVLLMVIYTCNTHAVVFDCSRKAQIMGGAVNHHWLKTDTKNAGMGSGNDGLIGDHFEAPYATHVFVIDHSNQTAEKCKEIKDIDEDCVNEQLDIGKPLGRFNLINNCQTFVSGILKECKTNKPDKYNSYGDYNAN